MMARSRFSTVFAPGTGPKTECIVTNRSTSEGTLAKCRVTLASHARRTRTANKASHHNPLPAPSRNRRVATNLNLNRRRAPGSGCVDFDVRLKMPFTWTFPQLFLILIVGFIGLAFSFSRLNPIFESLVPVLASHYLIINTICWNSFLISTTWQGGEDLFRFSLSPFLPAASLMLGVFAIAAVLWAGISVLRSRVRRSKRQLLGFSVFSIATLLGLIVSARIPIAAQAVLDSMPTPN